MKNAYLSLFVIIFFISIISVALENNRPVITYTYAPVSAPVNTDTSSSISEKDMYWLTQNIYHEARGESIYGQIMVGLVTLERVNDGRWGNNIKDVVTFPQQFSWHKKGELNIPVDIVAWKNAKEIAIITVGVYNMYKGNKVMFYHNDTVEPAWSKKLTKVEKIGNHTFYKE